MPHTCRNCKRTFSTELELELHRDTCSAGELICDDCGERFAERTATTDGWHYRCPNEDCDGEGIGDDIHRIDDIRVETN
ncbi:HVO_2901 family zinc finger protein [Halomicrobium urmianum]|uniref:HVO_2901 family zinc finger protein n=1 Tax=Halomicrobium urmianum TaxID=1586233 RepID=UPI001CD95230|nr:HVO_2901 family zinc finger protein [Halomicrobium urmianum]